METVMQPATAGRGIKSWPVDDRPREKFLLKGVASLSDAELIAILLRGGDRQRTALELAQELLKKAQDDLAVLSRLSVRDCAKVRGIGKVKAITVLAALELGRRRQSGKLQQRPFIDSASAAAKVLQPLLADCRTEVFSVLFLNTGNRVVLYERISEGGISGTVVDPKVLIRKALEADASRLILCHNHPSGHLKASQADKRLTERVTRAAAYFDIDILDHLIVSSEGYYSFADNGML